MLQQSIETLLSVDEDGAGSQYAISARRTVVLHETETEAADEVCSLLLYGSR
jgi:hypothetical protein